MNNVVKNSKTSPKKSVTAKQLAKSNLTKRKNPDWDNLDKGYRYLTLDMKLPHDLAVAVMGNVVEESRGDYKAVLKNGGRRGLIQWDGKNVPSGRYNLWGSIWASVAKPANVYDSTTDTVKNYWAPWGGLKGDKVRLRFIKAPIKEKARIYAESYIRSGKNSRISDRQLSAMQLDSIYNPRIKDIIVLKDGGMLEFLKNGGQIRKMLTAAGGPLNLSSEDIKRGANLIGEYFLKGLGAFGKIATAPFRSQGPTSATIYKSKKLLAKERTIENKSEELLGKAMTWVSPLNYGAALATGNGLNARKGEEEVASWSPAWQALGRAAELYVGPKAVKGVKSAPRVVVNTAAKAGVKPAKAAVVAREINKGIKQNTNNGRIEVTGNYFNSPDKWYRITETPEKYGIMELGKNVTTHDAPQTYGTINGWRSSMLKAPITKSSEGFIKRPQKIELGIRRKNGQAHGNTSQAAKGKLWGGTTSGSNLFPEGIIEGQAPSMINYGIDRTNFVMTPWELVPNGGRVGFHTGEMPMSNLGWFQKTNRGTYTYEPIIPEKRISYQPKLLLDSSTSLKFFERKPSKISEAEKAGVPKGERNQPLPKRSWIDLNLKNWRESLGLHISKDIDKVDPVDVKKFGESDYALANRREATKLYLKEKNNRESGVFSDLPVDIIKEYASKLGNPDTRFLNDNGLQSFYVRDYRQYLNDLGYNAGDLTDLEIAKLLTDQYNRLSKTLTGKLKGTVLFHSGPRFFDLFDYSNTGTTTGNMGYLGPGNYFSSEPSTYGGIGNSSTLNYMGKYRYPRRQPYLINNIKSTPVSKELQGKGIVPEYTSPPKESLTNPLVQLEYILSYIKPLVEATKPRDMAILDDISIYPHSKYTAGTQVELNVPRNTGIKSLFPHPQTFVRDANGNIIINRNWDDIRVNFKQGGKMNVEFLKNGSGIHIKEKNKGKFTSYCGGKVTNECILKGKNSSNPAIRKRATFAANARKWKHEDGGLLELLPIYGTYKDFERFKENPNWRTGASLGLSALGDLALFTGAGAIVKGLTTANKARRAYRAANSAANLARQKVWNAGSKLNRETLAVNSLTLMNAPTKTIMLRLALKNLAKQNYTAALNEDDKAFNALLKAGKNPNINFRGSDYIPFMVTNPSFHAASAAIKKNGGILKAQLGLGLTQFNNPENPNAVGGDIVNSYIRNQLMIPYLLALKEDYEKWKLQMKQQANTLKSSLFDNLLNTGLSIGTDYLKSKFGIKTEKADS